MGFHRQHSGLHYASERRLRRAGDAGRGQGLCHEKQFAGEGILARNPEGAGQRVGSAGTYADLSLFQIVEGLF
jgi:hypothetical protein